MPVAKTQEAAVIMLIAITAVATRAVAGGHGDQGKPNGNINSDSYTGNGGTGTAGINITMVYRAGALQVRRVSRMQYKYGGKVSVDVTVDENGTVTNAKVKPGSPFSDLNAIAEKRAYQLKFKKAMHHKQERS